MSWKRYYQAFVKSFSFDPRPNAPTSPSQLTGAGMTSTELGVAGMGPTDVDDTFGNELNQYTGKLNELVNVNEMLEPALMSPNRFQRYMEYDEMDDVELVAAAVDTYAAEASHLNIHNNVLKIRSSNARVVSECENLLFNQLNLNDEIESWYRLLIKYGDVFMEKVIDPNNTLYGVMKINLLSCDTMHRIETTRGRLIEYQQTNAGSLPDIESVKQDVRKYNASLADNMKKSQMHAGRMSHMNRTGRGPGRFQAYANSSSIRFTPEQIAHIRINKHRKGFMPYGVSILYPVRRVARQLKIMEDAMLIYRLVRAPERRMFFIDVGNLPPAEAMTYLEQIKNGLKKRKIFNHRTGSVDERINVQSQDEDYWIPTRPNSQTRIDTLPGGQNLGETNDVIYFQTKLLRGLKLPSLFLGGAEDATLGKLSTSSLYVPFAQRIEKIQRAMATGIKDILMTHLELRGFPLEEIIDLEVDMATPNDWREAIKRENVDARIQMFANALATNSFSTSRALQLFMGYTPDDSENYVREWEEEKIRRSMIEKGVDPDSPPIPLETELNNIAGLDEPEEDLSQDISQDDALNTEFPTDDEELANADDENTDSDVNSNTEDEIQTYPSWINNDQLDSLRNKIMAPLDSIEQEESDWPSE